ncbi:tropomyosin-like [Galleria mellonella]|uniref:Tropomyosin-like n=1 Tax=Galleria mellonella TaxID=7137 RepID=A0A6J1WIJ8_GALME|nr:tropomyosin-like [Galleria mellonella]
MSLRILHAGSRIPRNHSVRFTSEDLPKYKSLESPPDSSLPNYAPYSGPDSGAPSPDSCHFQPAAQRFRLNEQRIKLLTAINQIVQQRADLEANRATLSNLLEELKRKLKRRIEECHFEKKEKMKALKQANQRLEKEKHCLATEIDHLKRHLEKEEAHHVQHARTAVAQAIQGVGKLHPTESIFTPCSVADLPNMVSRSVAKNAPSRIADNKLAAARLMRDIAELRQRVAQVEARLANELKRKRQAELDIIRLRKELSTTKSCVASLRLPLQPLRKPCSKFA